MYVCPFPACHAPGSICHGHSGKCGASWKASRFSFGSVGFPLDLCWTMCLGAIHQWLMGISEGEELTCQVSQERPELRDFGTTEKHIIKDDSSDVKRKKMTSWVRKAKAITLREPHAEGWLLKGGLNALD